MDIQSQSAHKALDKIRSKISDSSGTCCHTHKDNLNEIPDSVDECEIVQRFEESERGKRDFEIGVPNKPTRQSNLYMRPNRPITSNLSDWLVRNTPAGELNGHS